MYMCLCVPVSVCPRVCVLVPAEARRGFSGAEVTGGCKQSDVGAGNGLGFFARAVINFKC